MAADRQQLINIIAKDRGIVRLSLNDVPIETLEAEVQKILEKKTAAFAKTRAEQKAKEEAAAVIAEEREQLALAQAELQAEADWTEILLTFIGSKRVKPIGANRSIIESWLNPGEQMTAAWFKKIITDQNLAKQLVWEEYKEIADTPGQLAKDRGVFESVAKSRNLSTHDLGFNLVREALGPGFDSKQMEQLLDSGKITLSKAKDEDHSEWQSQELLDSYQSDLAKLMELSKRALESNDEAQLTTLRNIKIDASNKYRMAELRAIAAAEREYYAGQTVVGRNHEPETGAPKSYRTSDLTPVERVDTRVYKPLPAEISAGDIKKANPADLRRLVHMYGNKQVNDRLRAA